MDRRGIDVWLGVVWILTDVAVPTVVECLSQWIYCNYLTSRLTHHPRLVNKTVRIFMSTS